MKRYLPTNDFLFKKMLATPGHEDVAKNLIIDCFGPDLQITGLEVIDQYSIEAVARAVAEGQPGQTALAETLRDITYGVELEVPGGKTVTVTVEMQNVANDRFLRRTLYYLATAYTNRYGSTPTDPYGSLRPVWALNIIGDRLFDDDIAFRINQFPPPGFTPDTEEWAWRLAFLELGKPLDDPRLAAWANLFRTGTARPEDPPYVHEAAAIVEYVNLRPEEIRMLDLHEKWRADQVTQEGYYQRMVQKGIQDGLQQGKELGIAQGREQGLEQGLEQGRELGLEQGLKQGRLEATIEVARKMLAAGQEPDLVAEIVGLDLPTVKSLLQ